MSSRPCPAASLVLAGAVALAAAAGAAPAAAIAVDSAGTPAAAGHRWSLDVEAGRVSTGYNDARIPSDGGTFFSLADDLASESRAYWRARLTRRLGARESLSLLVAPLRVDAAGALDRDLSFAGAVFPAGAPLQGRYRFDSYRLTWRHDRAPAGRWELGYGVTAKLRDAAIRVAGGGQTAEKKNTGFVPLLNFRLAYRVDPAWRLLLEGDALAAPQGRAEDVQLALARDGGGPLAWRLGYRLLEGGADAGDVYTFALLHYLFGAATLRF